MRPPKRALYLITCVVAIATLCCNVEADTRDDDGIIQQPSHRQSKEMRFNEDADDDADTSWTRLLEDWVVSNPIQETNRSSRQMYNTMARYGHPMPPPPPPPSNKDFYLKRRMGEAAPRNDQLLPPVQHNHGNVFRPNRPLNFEQLRQTTADISETDLYLLSAIEKLVHRVDYLEKRLQTTDKLILHLLNDVRKESASNSQAAVEQPILKPNRPTTSLFTTTTTTTTVTAKPITTSTTSGKPGSTATAATSTTIAPASTAPLPASTKPPKRKPQPAALCPRDFTSIAKVCYHFDGNELADWKTANGRCRSMGGHLAEFATAREYKAVSEYLTNGTRFTSSSFWLGGLNPGLLWIWSSSAKPVNPAANLAAFGSQPASNKNSTTVIPPKGGDGQKGAGSQKVKNVFDIQGNGRCLNLQYNRTIRNFEYFGEDCSRLHGFVCEMRNRNVENEISRVFRALNLE